MKITQMRIGRREESAGRDVSARCLIAEKNLTPLLREDTIRIGVRISQYYILSGADYFT